MVPPSSRADKELYAVTVESKYYVGGNTTEMVNLHLGAS